MVWPQNISAKTFPPVPVLIIAKHETEITIRHFHFEDKLWADKYRATKLWNELDSKFKDIAMFIICKKQLKQYMLSNT